MLFSFTLCLLVPLFHLSLDKRAEITNNMILLMNKGILNVKVGTAAIPVL